MVSAWHLLIGGAILACAAGAVEGFPALDWTPHFMALLSFLALAGTAVAFVMWLQETQRRSLGRLATWTFRVPLFVVGLRIVVLGERPQWWTVGGLALVPGSLCLALWPAPPQRSWPVPVVAQW